MADWLRAVPDRGEGGALTERGHFLTEEPTETLAQALFAKCPRRPGSNSPNK